MAFVYTDLQQDCMTFVYTDIQQDYMTFVYTDLQQNCLVSTLNWVCYGSNI